MGIIPFYLRLWDNMDDDQIITIATNYYHSLIDKGTINVSELARIIASEAEELSNKK